MKNQLYIPRLYVLLVFLCTATLAQAQIVLNTSPNTNTCNLSGDTVTVSVPTEVLTGDNIALNITLPGSYAASCVKTVTITKSSNLVFQSSGAIPFTDLGGGVYQNTTLPILAGNDGHNFNIFFKFPNYTTCDGTVGTFDVMVELDCSGEITTCTTSVNVIARAANYWSISKEFVTGNLTCGTSKWRIRLTHNNPNGTGLGTYKVMGTITESTVTVPIISGASYTVNNNGYVNSTWSYYVSLQNCSPDGTTITNIADYNFTLGNGTCGTMVGSVTATSPPLSSPNASISFYKSVSNPYYTNLTPGCDARYYITICNNGNVPWTNFVITDNLNIPGITITNILLPNGWTSSPSTTSFPATTYTFTAPSGYTLNPGECRTMYVDFTIDSGATIGSTISNTANISYQAANTSGGAVVVSGGGSSSVCPGISCPTIDTAIQNTTSTANFVVEAPKSIPSIKKCIINPPNSLIPPIYQIGDIITYTVMIGNSGSGDLSTVVSDAMGMPGQNLEIIPGSITYDYYANQYTFYKYSCSTYFSGSSSTSPPFSVVEDTLNLQNPSWTITNMPGICDYNRTNFLVITFQAEILPQIHGSKTNTAEIPNWFGSLSSSVNYTVDQVGVLAITKEADAEIVENGQTFNYIITVSNNGSVLMDNVVVTDMLPSCVSINGQISIEDGFATAITSTSSGNVIITVDPSAQIQPGDSFVITMPVIKSGGGNCCNESVSVTAEMITSYVELDANFGSAQAPAACVTGTECCDIDGFDASIEEHNGSFIISINGGSVPIQEVEISMVDYHIEYSNEDCKPKDMGNFGTLSSTTTNLASLILNASDNNTSSLSLLLGDPAIINSSVILDIIDPLALNLDCCDVDFYFCLKVWVKDVNCNVCEIVICYSSEQEPEPCEISIKDLEDKKYCPGDTIVLNWNGTTPSGTVNLSLFDNTNATVYQVIATNLPNTGTYTYTIPSGIPCDPPRSWSLIVEDSERLCLDRSDPFTIECCQQQTDCNCGEWLTDYVTVTTYLLPIPQNPDLKSTIPASDTNAVTCGKNIELKPSKYYTFTAPNYACNPENCDVSYIWSIVDTKNNIIQSGKGKTFNYSFSNFGNYEVIFTPICGGIRCEPCTIYVEVEKPIIAEPLPVPNKY